MFAITRRVVCALAATVALAGPASAETVLKVALHSDLKIIDPMWTTALISIHHGNMVFDTLFALDEKLEIKPQMVDKWEVSPDKLTWTFTLRDGLEFHDGTPVTAADCVASIRRCDSTCASRRARRNASSLAWLKLSLSMPAISSSVRP